MSSRILIGADHLREILTRHPEVEVELLRSAVPQIAEMIRRKAVEKEPAMKSAVEETFHRLMLEQGTKYGISEAMRGVIRVYLAEVWREEAKNAATGAARDAAKEEASKIVMDLTKLADADIAKREAEARERINAYAREAAEREVMALLRAGKLTVAP